MQFGCLSINYFKLKHISQLGYSNVYVTLWTGGGGELPTGSIKNTKEIRKVAIA